MGMKYQWAKIITIKPQLTGRIYTSIIENVSYTKTFLKWLQTIHYFLTPVKLATC